MHTQEPQEHALLSEVLDEAVEARRDKETGEMARTMAQVLEQRGQETGRRADLMDILQDKFGYSAEEARAIVRNVPASQLRATIRRAARVTTREELDL